MDIAYDSTYIKRHYVIDLVEGKWASDVFVLRKRAKGKIHRYLEVFLGEG